MAKAAAARDDSGSQFRTLVWKHSLLKWRHGRTTCCEVVSPIMFLLLLVLGYTQSGIDYFGAATYAAMRLDAGPLVELAVEQLDAMSDEPEAFAPSAACGANGTASNSSCGDGLYDWSPGGGTLGGGRSVDVWALRRSLDPLLAGPVPVIPFDTFVGLSLALRRGLSGALWRRLNSWNWYSRVFGNVLTLGALHLAPDTAQVHSTAQHSTA
jgi:hypothetical protein